MTAMQRIEPGTTPNTIDVDPHSKLSQVAFQGTVTGAHARATQVKIGFFPQNLAAPQPDDDHVCTMPLQEGSFLGFAKANVDLNSGDEYQLWGWVGHGNTWDGPHGLGTNYVSAAPDRRPPLLHVPLLNAVNALQLPRESLVEILHATIRLAAPRILEPADTRVRYAIEDFTPIPGGGALKKAIVVDSLAKRVIVTVQRPNAMINQYPVATYLVDAIKGANSEWTATRIPLAVVEPNLVDPPQNRLVAWSQYSAQVWGVCSQTFYGGYIR